ncbi:MAG TPA: hypothetical protein VGD56_01755, partial [Gemmatirosa sp.]
MPKAAVLRLQEAVMAARGLAPDLAAGDVVVRRIEAWLGPLPDGDVATLSADLAFGGWHPLSSATERALRNDRRALLLVRASMRPDAATFQAYKERVRTMSAATIRQEFVAITGTVAPAADADFSLASSFQYATPAERDRALQGAREYLPLVQSCLRHLTLVPHNVAQRAIYERWFGAFNAARYQGVLMTVSQLRATAKRMKLYYRGDNVPPVSRGAMEPVPDPNGTPRLVQRMPFDAGYYLHGDRETEADTHFVHVFLGSAYFGSKVQRFTFAGVSAGRAGVILHEMTHGVCATNDEILAGAIAYG